MPRFKTVSQWAEFLGSKAKTPAGQRKAILASFRVSEGVKGLRLRARQEVRTYHNYYQSTTRQDWHAQQQRRRQETFAATHPLTTSLPLPATVKDILGEARTERTLQEMLESERGRYDFCRVAGWYVRTSEEGDWNRSRYSKSWHNAHGGVWEVSARTVHIRRAYAAPLALPGACGRGDDNADPNRFYSERDSCHRSVQKPALITGHGNQGSICGNRLQSIPTQNIRMVDYQGEH